MARLSLLHLTKTFGAGDATGGRYGVEMRSEES